MASVHIAFCAPRAYADIFADVSRRLGLSHSAFIRRCVEHFIATEVDPQLAGALAAARSSAAILSDARSHGFKV